MSTIETELCHCRRDPDVEDEGAPIRPGHCPDCGADRFVELGRVRAYLGRCPHCHGGLFTEDGDFCNDCPTCKADQRLRFHVIYAKFHDMAHAAIVVDPSMSDLDGEPGGTFEVRRH